jgi:hypothetical protein
LFLWESPNPWFLLSESLESDDKQSEERWFKNKADSNKPTSAKVSKFELASHLISSKSIDQIKVLVVSFLKKYTLTDCGCKQRFAEDILREVIQTGV